MLSATLLSLWAIVTLSPLTMAAPIHPNMNLTQLSAAFAPVNVPKIDPGFTDQEMQQLKDAFGNAMLLASYARTEPDSLVDPIFANWFDKKDKGTVMEVFDNIMGTAPPSQGKEWPPIGNPILADITIVTDYIDPVDGLWACDGQTRAETRLGDTDNPKIIVCKEGFSLGGLGLSYPNVAEVNCDLVRSNNDRISSKVDTLGSVLLHEYTHFEKLVQPQLPPGATVDLAYGPWDCQGNDATLKDFNKSNYLKNAKYNADSYSFFASQVTWSTICWMSFGLPNATD